MDLIQIIANSDRALLSLLVLAMTAAGIFIDRRVWPWLIVFIEKRHNDMVELEKMRLQFFEKSDARWSRSACEFRDEMRTVTVQLAVIREQLDQTDLKLANGLQVIDLRLEKIDEKEL